MLFLIAFAFAIAGTRTLRGDPKYVTKGKRIVPIQEDFIGWLMGKEEYK